MKVEHYREGKRVARGQASRALYRRHGGWAELESPRVETAGGDAAEAARAELDGAARVATGGPVTLHGPGYEASAPRFVAAEGRVELSGGVRTELRR